MSKSLDTLTATSSSLPPLGFYIGHLTNIEDMGVSTGQFGEQHQVRLIVRVSEIQMLDNEDDEEEAENYLDQDVHAYANLSFTPRSKLRRWCGQIAGRTIEDGEEFSVQEIMGADVRVQVGLNTVGNPTVKDIWRYRKPTKKRRPKPEPEEEFEDDEDEDF